MKNSHSARLCLSALCAVLVLTCGCTWLGGQRNVPEAVAQAYSVETQLIIAYDHDASAFVEGLIAEPPEGEAEQAEALRIWADIRSNYHNAMRLRGAIAAWLGLADALKEVVDAGQ